MIAGLNSVRNATFTLGAFMSTPTLTVTSRSPYLRMKQDYVIQPDYNKYFDASFGQGNSSTTRHWEIHSSTAVTGNTLASLEMPDLSGVTGWQNTWGLQAGQSTNFGFTATGYTGTIPSTGLTQGVFDGLIYLSGTKNLLTAVVN